MNDGRSMLATIEIGSGRVLGTVAQATPGGLPGESAIRPGRESGGAEISLRYDRAQLRLSPTGSYADAQLDDTAGRARRNFRWKPPLRLSLRARTSDSAPLGTFGFGFWNDPFSLALGQGGAARKFPTAPQCVWFFYGSPPLDLPLAPGVPGRGWKAATLCSRVIPPLLLAPLAAGGMALAGLPFARRWVFERARSFYRAEETLLPVDPSRWHSYAIEWLPSHALFSVDGKEVLQSSHPPSGPLGLVLWIDNQYAVASAAGGFSFGVIPLEKEQNLELEDVRIEPLPAAC
jgi:hypothetical protein